MARSSKKLPFISFSILKKIQDPEIRKRQIKTYSRRSAIYPEMVGLTFLVLTFVDIISTIIVLGFPIKESYDLNLDTYTLNSLDNSILISLNKPFISITSTVVSRIFYKYYIHNVGLVFRWSKQHKMIEAKFKELNNLKQNDSF